MKTTEFLYPVSLSVYSGKNWEKKSVLYGIRYSSWLDVDSLLSISQLRKVVVSRRVSVVGNNGFLSK